MFLWATILPVFAEHLTFRYCIKIKKLQKKMLLDSTWRNISVCKLLLSPCHTLFCLYHNAMKHSVTVQFFKNLGQPHILVPHLCFWFLWPLGLSSFDKAQRELCVNTSLNGVGLNLWEKSQFKVELQWLIWDGWGHTCYQYHVNLRYVRFFLKKEK